MKRKAKYYLLERGGNVDASRSYTKARAMRSVKLANRLGAAARKLQILSVTCLDDSGKVKRITVADRKGGAV
ncbi:MAG: hypothetical protein K8T25_12880 [Planctomycetia bacterium]|nr:hypothetical protein [Planctomycetia bacterium]